ncbi:MAG: universal stress protein [Kiloniellales bacterium]|nr:universal stress protein [Kiloniellales bacterium]
MNQIVDTLVRPDRVRDEATTPAPVLVAVEFSKSSEAALRWACDHAEAVGAPLEILHVIHDPADSPGSYKPDVGDPLEPIADVAERRLAQYLDSFGRDNARLSGLAGAKRLCVEGLPAAKILDVARAHNACLLVLGSRPRNGLGRLVHGSTAVQIAREAALPVTIVKSDG